MRRGVAVALAILARTAPSAAQTEAPIVYEVDGVRVVHGVTPGREVVAVQIYLLGGARQITPATAGVELLILDASEWGSEGFPGDSLRAAQVATGSGFFASVGPDWSVMGFTGLVEEFDASWAVLADRLARPTLDSTSVERVRAQALTFLRAQNEDPDAAVEALAARLAFAGHPYALDVSGTEESLTKLTAADLRAYHDAQFVRSRLLMSVVGDVDRARVEAAVRATLSSLPLGAYVWELPPSWAKPSPDVVVEERGLATNYLLGYFPGPDARDDDYAAFQVALIVLSSVISSQVRDRGLSYAAGAPFLDRAAPGGGIYASTGNPGETMEIVNATIEAFSAARIPRNIVGDVARSFNLDYLLSNQTTSQQASFQATSLLLTGQHEAIARRAEAFRRVSGTDIQRIFRNYMRNIQYGYLGWRSQAPEDLMREY